MNSTRMASLTPEVLELNRLKIRARWLRIVCFGMLIYATAGLLIALVRYPSIISQTACFQLQRGGQIPSSRGRIFDSNKNAIVDNRIVSTMFVNPSRVKDDQRQELIDILCQNFACDPMTITDALNATDKTRFVLSEELTGAELERFNSLKLDSSTSKAMQEVGLMTREVRYYPNGPIASPLLGFTACRDEGQVGLWGIEEKYDDVLAGRPGEYTDTRDQRGRRIPFSREEVLSPRYGTDLVLTIDSDIQVLAESALSAGIMETNSIGGAVVVTDPVTGNVLALASLPTYDPIYTNDFISNKEAYFSRSTALSYEPGSVMKIFTIAAGLEEKVITPTSSLHVTTGKLKFKGGYVPDHAPPPVADLDIRTVVVKSSNRGAALVAVMLGHDRINDWFHKFGFGVQTPLGLPGEPSGNLKESLKPFPEIDLADMGFGQGITISPLQLAQGLGVFANGGSLVPLRLVKGRRDPGCSDLVQLNPSDPVQVLSPDTAATMQNFMIGVVEEGTATKARNGWVCAGKTGTAQKVINGNYGNQLYFATFAGYGPIPDPKYVIVVILDEPRPDHYGGSACGPIFRTIFNALMIKEGIPPSRKSDGTPVSPGDIQTASDITQPAQTANQADYITNAKGYVISSDPFESGNDQG
jgi:cell division protein FtsI/penicillin-binding protein 2